MRAALRHVANVLIVAGVLLLADAALTVVWQEPMSAYLAHRQQNKLSKTLVELDRAGSSPLETRALHAIHDQSARVAFLARSLRRRVDDGGALGRIVIPKIGASYVFVNGTNTADLRKGPGLYEETPLPGVSGTVAIAGHRTTYGAPFRHVDELEPGDTIRVELPYGDFTYSVERRLIVKPTALWVTHRVGHDRLVLSACHPLYSAAKRIIVFARLARTQVRGAAAA
ncbi:MAG TPA: class E sortase [Solirubrobacteraceae bacterium]|nr:class E sortase [Solirubrobacteraceae bacterium]